MHQWCQREISHFTSRNQQKDPNFLLEDGDLLFGYGVPDFEHDEIDIRHHHIAGVVATIPQRVVAGVLLIPEL